MTQYDWALIFAGLIGVLVSVFHGILMQRLMIRPILAHAPLAAPSQRLVPLLLHFSTFVWFSGGVALIAVTLYADASSKFVTALFVIGFYGFGTIGNLWGTRGKHPGWALLALAVALTIYGAPPLV